MYHHTVYVVPGNEPMQVKVPGLSAHEASPLSTVLHFQLVTGIMMLEETKQYSQTNGWLDIYRTAVMA